VQPNRAGEAALHRGGGRRQHRRDRAVAEPQQVVAQQQRHDRLPVLVGRRRGVVQDGPAGLEVAVDDVDPGQGPLHEVRLEDPDLLRFGGGNLRGREAHGEEIPEERLAEALPGEAPPQGAAVGEVSVECHGAPEHEPGGRHVAGREGHPPAEQTS
jgi:hypothetical protein